MLRRALFAPTALLTLAALSGCSAQPATEATPTLAPTAATAAAYTCDDMAALDDVATLFVGADGAVPTPVAATQPVTSLTTYAVPAIGGLSCSWRVGLPADDPFYDASRPDSNWAYLTVDVVPDAADSWTPNVVYNEPVDTLTGIDGVEAAAACDNSECVISAPVGDAWVEIAMSLRWFETLAWTSAGWTTDTVLAQMQPLAVSVFTVLADAVPGQLVWPAVDRAPQEPACTGVLQAPTVAAALGVDSVEYAIVDLSDPAFMDFDNYLASAAGLVECEVYPDSRGFSITKGDGLAGVVVAMASEPDADAAMSPIALQGAVDGELALHNCTDAFMQCTVVFSLSDSAYEVQVLSDPAAFNNVVAVAEALIVEAR